MMFEEMRQVGTLRLVLASAAITFVFMGWALVWAAHAPLSTAAIAPGVANVLGESKTVQHLEGGIVQSIHVSNGDVVKARQPLVILQDIAARSRLNVLKVQKIGRLTELARRDAERLDLSEIAFSDWLVTLGGEAEAQARKSMREQQTLFETRLENLNGAREIVELRIQQIENEIEGLEDRIGADEKQLALVMDRQKAMNKLARRGLVPSDQIYELKQLEAQFEGAIGENKAAIAGARGRILELRSEITQLEVERRSEASERYTMLLTELGQIETELSAARDEVERRTVRAPSDGVVHLLSAHTIGGVVAPGQPILTIVPSQRELIIDARLQPKDRDSVHVGATAEIRFMAAGQRRAPPVSGTLVSLSPDRIVDPVSSESYYLARVSFDQEDPAIRDVFPGMAATVAIVTGERAALSYVTEPLMQSFWRSMREK